MRLAGNVTRTGESIGVRSVLVGKPEGKNHLENTGIELRIILRRSFRKCGVRVWTGLMWLRIGTGVGHL